MAKSIISDNRKRKPGRPPVGSTLVGVRVPPDELADIDDWAARQKEPLTRPEAIRTLVRRGLGRGRYD